MWRSALLYAVGGEVVVRVCMGWGRPSAHSGACKNLLKLSGFSQGFLGPSGTFSSLLESPLSFLESYGASWNLLEPSGAALSFMEQVEVFLVPPWSILGPS